MHKRRAPSSLSLSPKRKLISRYLESSMTFQSSISPTSKGESAFRGPAFERSSCPATPLTTTPPSSCVSTDELAETSISGGSNTSRGVASGCPTETVRALSSPSNLDAQSQNSSFLRKEPSRNDTVVCPSPRQHRRSSSRSMNLSQPADSFPVFTEGDVIVRIDSCSPPRSFQLHSTVLTQHSSWFSHLIQPTTNEQKPPWYLFVIEEIDGKVTLVQKNAEGDCPEISHAHQLQAVSGVEIKLEVVPDEVEPIPPSSSSIDATTATGKMSPEVAIACYTQIFGTFYNIPPPVSTIDIATALEHSERLVKIATELGCLHLLRPYLGNIFSHYRQKLFLAIKSDPARWILLATCTENKSIYTECLVHLIGAHPRWHPDWTTRRNALPEHVQNLIKRKSAELAQLRTEIDRDLLLATLPYGRTRRPLDPTNPDETETWITVQVFRDILAQQIYAFDRKKCGSVMDRGAFYRGIHKGTLPELDVENVRRICQGVMASEWSELGEDLKRLVEYAGRVVEELAVNELMVEPDWNGVGYVTCATIRDEEVPWLAGVQSSN